MGSIHEWSMDPSLFQNKLFKWTTYSISPTICKIAVQLRAIPKYVVWLISIHSNSGSAEVHTRYQSAIMQSCSAAWCETAGIYCKQTYWMMTSQRALSMRVRSFPQKKNNKKKLSIFLILACIFHEGRGTYFRTSRTVQPDSSIASRISTSLADFQSSRQGSSITISFLLLVGTIWPPANIDAWK